MNLKRIARVFCTSIAPRGPEMKVSPFGTKNGPNMGTQKVRYGNAGTCRRCLWLSLICQTGCTFANGLRKQKQPATLVATRGAFIFGLA